MPRPQLPESDRHSDVFRVRLRRAEGAAFKHLAETINEPPGRVLRRLVREAITGGPDFFRDDIIDLRTLHRQVAAIGNNLNQLVRSINRGEQVAPDDLRRVVHAAHVQLTVVRETYMKAVQAAVQRAIVPLCEEAGLRSPFDLQDEDFLPASQPARRRGRPPKQAERDPAAELHG